MRSISIFKLPAVPLALSQSDDGRVGSPCAGPQALVRGRRGQRTGLSVSYLAGRKHLPIVELKKAA